MSRDAEASCYLVVPFILKKHIHPFGILNPKNYWYMNSVIQLIFSILKTISHNFQFNSSTEGSLSKFLFETAHSASSFRDVDALKFRLVQSDNFYGGVKQEDASERLTMLIELINKGQVPYCGSNYNNSTGISLSEILFSFMLEKYIVWTLGLIALPTESPGGGFDYDRINVFFMIWFYIKLVCMCEGCLVMCGMIAVINLGFDSFRFMENLLFSRAIDMNRVFPCHHKSIWNSVAGREGRVVVCALIVSLHKNRVIRNPYS